MTAQYKSSGLIASTIQNDLGNLTKLLKGATVLGSNKWATKQICYPQQPAQARQQISRSAPSLRLPLTPVTPSNPTHACARAPPMGWAAA
jgi:hypothetical protein